MALLLFFDILKNGFVFVVMALVGNVDAAFCLVQFLLDPVPDFLLQFRHLDQLAHFQRLSVERVNFTIGRDVLLDGASVHDDFVVGRKSDRVFHQFVGQLAGKLVRELVEQRFHVGFLCRNLPEFFDEYF